MSKRSERRRRLRAGREPQAPLFRPRDLLIATAIGAGTLVAIAILVILSIGGDGGDDDVSVSPTTSPVIQPSFSPSNPDEVAIENLARESIEVLPRDEWPSLYDMFTSEYQQRCNREDFEAAGEAGAAEQGENLPLLGFVGLTDVVIEGETATAVIVGEIKGSSQYRVRAAFQKVENTWKLSPAAGTEGCAAFDRISG